ncbi:MAG: DUF262 domain-containing protein [Lachnospiraceae bacterium]|nr:DUF262 domain-containing protein [Lachnospiraceae bacterium]
MIKGKQSWTVTNIMKMYKDKKVLSFDHPIQRKSEAWSVLQKSLLIHSMLSGYPVPNIYVLREDSELLDEKKKPIYNFSVLDGKQRLTNVLSYLEGDYPLSDNIPNVTIEDEEYEISGKYFSDLDEAVRYELQRYKFEIFSFEQTTNDEVEEIFFRLNNATPLTKSQVSKAKIGTEMATLINELLASKFYAESCSFSKGQIKNSDDQKTLLLGMMLLDYLAGSYEMKDFSENTLLEYSEHVKNTYTEEQKNTLVSCIEYLTDAFPKKDKQLRKITIPMLMVMANVSMEHEIKPMYFRQWFECFTVEDNEQELYKRFCSSGSTKLEKIKGRLAVITNSFCEFQEIEAPEYLINIVEEVYSKLEDSDEEDDTFNDNLIITEEETNNTDTDTEAENNMPALN